MGPRECLAILERYRPTTKQAYFDGIQNTSASVKSPQIAGISKAISKDVLSSMQRLTKGVTRCSLGLSTSFKVQKRLLSEVVKQPSSTHQSIETTPLAQRPKSQTSRAKEVHPQTKKPIKKRPPVAWPQRPGQDPAEMTAYRRKTAIEYPYFVPRNSNGCVPVYSDFKSNRTREITLIRNVEGNVHALKDDLIATLFPDTPNNRFWNQRLKTNIRVHHNRHVVMQGGRWVSHVHKWLLARGF